MCVTLVLGTEATVARFTPGMLPCSLQVSSKLNAATKSQKTDQTGKLMANVVVVLEMVLQGPAILEGTQA